MLRFLAVAALVAALGTATNGGVSPAAAGNSLGTQTNGGVTPAL